MKKILMIILVAVMASISIFAFSGCSSTSVSGVAWASSETFVYDIYDSDQDDAVIGTLTYTVEVLPVIDADDENAAGYTIDGIPNQTFVITETVRKGARIIMEAVDLDGNVMMYSEAITNGFTSLAAYKEVNYGGTSFTYAAYSEDSRWYYSIDGSDFDSFKSSTDIDSTSLYNLIRGYDLGSAYSASIEVINPTDASTESFYLSTTVSDTITAKFDYSTAASASVNSVEVDTYMVTLTKNDAPIGGSIAIYYSAYDSSVTDDLSASFYAKGSTSSLSSSFHIPVRIEENNLTYVLTEATFA